MTRWLVASLALACSAGCSVLTNDFYADRDGEVYECPEPGFQTWEFCSNLDGDELGRQLQRTCHRTAALLLALQGCDFGCDGESGCEARHGCYCAPHWGDR